MMHRIIRDHLEEVLTGLGSAPEHPAGKHLAECEECRDAVTAMRAQAAILQQWIEAQGPGSVWALFFDTLFARRIAMASLALALLLGVYVISSEQMSEPQTASVDGLPQAVFSGDVFSDNAQPRLVTAAPDQDAVLVNLVTYREQ